jgi:hypothetical protein
MFCPNCGLETREALKFCKQCGSNLSRVQGVMGKGGAGAKSNGPLDWNKAALDEYQEERERKKKKTPEEKRFDEIKGGVITASIGLGLMIFLRFLFQAIASGMPWQEANIMRGLWWVGWIPFLIGLGIIFNGVVIGKKVVELKRKQENDKQQPVLFPVPNTSPVPRLTEASQPAVADYSVTESTTTKLREPVSVPSSRDAN